MTLTRKGTRVAAAADMAKDYLQSNHKSVADGEEVEEDDETSDSEKRNRDIA